MFTPLLSLKPRRVGISQVVQKNKKKKIKKNENQTTKSGRKKQTNTDLELQDIGGKF